MRGVSYHYDVGSVPKTSCEFHLRTRPPPFPFFHAEMHSTGRIRPSVITVVKIVQPSAIAGNRANLPIVSAEMKRLGGSQLGFADTLYDRHSEDSTTSAGCYVHG